MSARPRGFTLVEILVALTVLAVVLATATGALRASARAASEVEARLYAHWIASNALAEAVLAPPAHARRRSARYETFMDRSYRVITTTRGIAGTNLLETTVEVSDASAPGRRYTPLAQRFASS